MNIETLTITEKELTEAVGMFLKTKGVDIPIETVSKNYGGRGGYKVEFKEDETPIAPAPQSPE